jgi:hemerythrin superfamily protein
MGFARPALQPKEHDMPTLHPNPTARAAGQESADAVSALVADHREVKSLFTQYQKLADAKAPEEERELLASQICVLLTVHTHIEEEIFYPEARDALGEDGKDLLDEALVEHAGAKNLIRELKAMEADDELYDAKVKVLGENIDHHVEEEETELFPKVRKSSLDLDDVGARMEARKEELMASPQELEPLPNE